MSERSVRNCAALVYTSAHYEIVRGKWKSDNVKETYILVENNIWYRTYYDKRDNTMGTPLSKEKMGERYERTFARCM